MYIVDEAVTAEQSRLKKEHSFDTMQSMDLTQILGYTASFVIFISLMMKSIIKLRILNAVGCVLFTVFALKTNSIPAVVMNIGIVLIDMYYFYRMVHVKDHFEILEVDKNNEIVRYFFNKNERELITLFNNDAFKSCDKLALYFRNNDIAGLVAYAVKDTDTGKTADILIDFVVPKYRDLAIGRHFFINDLHFWHRQGFTTLEARSPSETHIPYLKRLGFVYDDSGGIWKKTLKSI